MNIGLSDHFTYSKLLRFTLPSIVMMIFTSIYGVVDGFFVSNFAEDGAFAAVNFIMPFLMILGTVGFVFGTGGSALVANIFGEGDKKKANSLFSLFIYFSFAIGVVIAVIGFISVRPIASLLGADGQLLEDCVTYGRIIILAIPAFILQMEFQSFFVTAEKPNLGLVSTIASGVANMILDLLLVAVIPLGIRGAAWATAISQIIGALIPMIYFSLPNNSLLRLSKTYFDGKAIVKACVNGSSEFMSNIAMSVVGMLYNVQLLRYAEENGVSAYGVLMYVSMIFNGAFIGYSVGIAPVIGYHNGAKNHDELHGLLKKSLILIGICSVCMVGASEVLAYPLSNLFVGSDPELFDMTLNAFRIYSFSFLFMGVAIFASGFFTALNDGVTSAVISFLRTCVFQIAAVLLLPLIWELDGIWYSIIVAEVMAAALSGIFIIVKKKKYNY